MTTKSEEFKHILFRRDQATRIIHIVVNRPNKLNALNNEVLQELKILLRQLQQELKENLCPGIILSGSGEKAFIAGADIAEMSQLGHKEAFAMGQLGQTVTLLFERLPVPVVAAVHGFALGGGMEMAMSCDFIFASERAIFGQPEVKLGLIPGFGGTQRLTRLVGRQRAKEIIFTGAHISAQQALDLGLVSQVYPDKEELVAGAEKFLQSMAGSSPLGVSFSKKAINEGADLPLGEGMAIELEQFSRIFGTQDMKIGTQAFLEKRKAQFTGG